VVTSSSMVPWATEHERTPIDGRCKSVRSIHAGLDHLLLTTWELRAATAQLRTDAAVSRNRVPTHTRSLRFPALPRCGCLFRYADECAKRDGSDDVRAYHDEWRHGTCMASARQWPCPADDAFIRYLPRDE